MVHSRWKDAGLLYRVTITESTINSTTVLVYTLYYTAGELTCISPVSSLWVGASGLRRSCSSAGFLSVLTGLCYLLSFRSSGPESAVCVFTLQDIRTVFTGSYRNFDTQNHQWGPMQEKHSYLGKVGAFTRKLVWCRTNNLVCVTQALENQFSCWISRVLVSLWQSCRSWSFRLLWTSVNTGERRPC